MKTDREKIAILVGLLEERQWDYEPDNGTGSYNYCRECGWDNHRVDWQTKMKGLKHKPGCPIAEALLYATPLFSVVALMRRGSEVLAISRKDNHEDLGLPGGKIDEGETPEKALAREMDEEIGCRPLVMVPAFEHLDRVEGDQRRPCRCYLVLEWEGEPRSKEGARLVWGPPQRLLEPSCSFHEYNRKLFTAVLPSVV